MLSLVLNQFTSMQGPLLVPLHLNLALRFVGEFILDQSVLVTCILAQIQVLDISRGKLCLGNYLDKDAGKECKLS